MMKKKCDKNQHQENSDIVIRSLKTWIILLALGIASSVRSLIRRQESQSHQATGPDQSKKSDVRENTALLGRLIGLLESKLIQDQSRENQEELIQQSTLKWIKGYTVLTGGILVGTLYQSCVSHDTLIDSQRPWVVAASAEISSPFRDQPMPIGPLVKFRIKNYGNSIATQGWLFATIEPNDSVWLSANWQRACKNIDSFRRESDIQQKKTKIGAWPIGFLLPPGDDVFETVGATPILEVAEKEAIRKRGNSTSGKYIIACMEYTDQFGAQHVTTTCFNSDPNYAGLSNSEGLGLTKCNAYQTGN